MLLLFKPSLQIGPCLMPSVAFCLCLSLPCLLLAFFDLFCLTYVLAGCNKTPASQKNSRHSVFFWKSMKNCTRELLFPL